MKEYSDNQEFYDDILSLCPLLAKEGADESARKLEYLIKDCVWTTSSEIFVELKSELKKIQCEKLEEDTRGRVLGFIECIDAAFTLSSGRSSRDV